MHLTMEFPKNMKQKLAELKGEKDNSARIVGDFSTPFPIMDEATKQISKETGRFEQCYKPIRQTSHL